MENEQQPKAIVSAILLKKQEGEFKFFLQTRWKPQISPTYSGMIEIPAGGIDAYENVYDALKREIKEETNLDIIKIVDDYRGNIIESSKNNKAFVFKPYICQQVLETNNGLPWIGFVFLCEVEGEVIINGDEAKDPKWVSIKELEEIVRKEAINIFPLQLPVLKYFVENFKDEIKL